MFSIELTHRQEDKHLTSMEGSYILHDMKYECNIRGGFTRDKSESSQNVSYFSYFISIICESQARSQIITALKSTKVTLMLCVVILIPHLLSFQTSLLAHNGVSKE